ncbi:MAG: rubrerythrin family protein [Bacteroidales bacterium]
MEKIKGTKTEANLKKALDSEALAVTKYTLFAKKAKKDGYVQIGDIFEQTAANEMEHAKIWFKLLHGDEMPDSESNLLDAIDEENYEWSDMYDNYAREAHDEGFERIAFLFEKIAAIEKEHETRYRKLLSNIKKGIVFSRDGDQIWECIKCGHIVIGHKAPAVCAVCQHPKGYFAIKSENY